MPPTQPNGHLQDAEYLDDGVYAAPDGYQIWVYTHNGIDMLKPPIALTSHAVVALKRMFESGKAAV